MNVFDYYVLKNADPNWVAEYQSTSDKKSGKTFLYTNTNFRSLFAFTDVYSKFLEYNNRPRSEWQTYQNGETMAKHWTVRMQQSKLFRLLDNKYVVTAKGKAFGDLVSILENEGMEKDTEWVLIYYFVLNSYFGFKTNYLIQRTREVYNALKNAGVPAIDINKAFEEVLRQKDDLSINDIFKMDAFWYLTFFKDQDFMTLYSSASSDVKRLLHDRVIFERTNPDSIDLIGHKYKNSGQYNASMFIDDVCVLYVTFETLLKDNRDALILMDNICNVFERFGTVDKKFLDNFVRTHYDVFEVIFNEAILDEDVDDEINGEDIEEDEEVGAQSERIDDTTNLTRTILRNTRAILKRMAKERADYKCELSIIRSCSYFTSREDNHNYLEIHHLIPFAFSNEFENTLETIDNYVALCPNCHRLLHHGSDRERKAALTYLYNIRKDKLKEAGLEITLEQLFDFYQVTDN